MKLPYEWVKEFVTFKYTPQELADVLTMHSLEVEEIYDPKSQIENVVTGKIENIEKHPNADRLIVCQVNIGQKEMIQIVTGATNLKVQDIVPVAIAPAKLPGGIKIEKGKLRGEVSMGMMCSKAELGLGEDPTGVLVLPGKTSIGKTIVQVLDFPEAVLEIAVLPNRPDCLSVTGLAREISAITGNSLRAPKLFPIIKKGTSLHKARVAVKQREACPRYMARLIQNVEVKPSPEWMQKKLLSVGIRPINNVVDITNFVLMETGQPMHAFDFKKLEGGQINVRYAKKGEKIKLLSNQEYEFQGQELVIADKRKPVALAGVMGGMDASVSSKTKTILLESAIFNPIEITKSVKVSSIRTDSSVRFEKGVHWDGVSHAMQRAVALLNELSGSEVVSDAIDEKRKDPEGLTIDLRFSRMNHLLGIEVPIKEAMRILEFLGFDLELLGDKLSVTVPSFRRSDVTREVDLIEEIVRIYGYNKVPETLPVLEVMTKKLPIELKISEDIKNTFTACGFDEALTYPLTKEELNLSSFELPYYQGGEASHSLKKAIEISNPLPDAHILRDHLLGNLLNVLQYQLAHQTQNVKLFEFGKIFYQQELVKGSSSTTPFNESKHISAVVCGNYWEQNFSKSLDKEIDFYWFKGVLEKVFENLSIPVPGVERSQHPWFHPGRTARFKNMDWIFGEVHPDRLRKLGVKNKRVYALEGSLGSFLKLSVKELSFKSLPKLPYSRKDLAVVIRDTVSFEQVKRTIQKFSGPKVEEIECFDMYQGDPIKEGFKSLAIGIYYRDNKQTLKDTEILQMHTHIQEGLKKDLAAEIR